MTPAEAGFLFDFLLPQLCSEQAVTSRIMAAVDDGDYRPHPKSMTAFELARHIAICELWFLDAILQGQFDDVQPVVAASCQELAVCYAESTAQRVAMLRQLSPEALAKRIDYIGLRNDPAVAYLNIAIRHTVHHRGQLSAYLRGMGATVPAIYVESADEPYPPADGSADDVRPPAF